MGDRKETPETTELWRLYDEVHDARKSGEKDVTLHVERRFMRIVEEALERHAQNQPYAEDGA